MLLSRWARRDSDMELILSQHSTTPCEHMSTHTRHSVSQSVSQSAHSIRSKHSQVMASIPFLSLLTAVSAWLKWSALAAMM